MRKQVLVLLTAIASFTASAQKVDSLFIRNIYDIALEEGEAYDNLRSLCKDIGARVTGSAEAQMAVKWGKVLLKSYNFDKVYLQEITVPHWERGTKEAAWIANEAGDIMKLNILALGGSASTNGLLSGELVEIKNVEELKKAPKEKVDGKIVFLSQPFDQKLINTFHAYGHCYPLRGNGANEASVLGAKAVIIRSLATPTDNFPHTGITRFKEDVKHIPAAAMSTQNADEVSKWLAKGKVTLKMELNCKTHEDITSYNVIAEMTGKDDKIISFGGHLDSWDVGEGAHDDGAGIVHSIEALRILKKLNYQPNHTLRCVLFMNEENGNFGGKSYAKLSHEAGEKHIGAIESDRGGFLPIGFDVSGTDEHLTMLKQYQGVLFDYDLLKFTKGHSGVDIGPLKEYYPDIMQVGLKINSQQYFNYHHTDADVFESVNKRELELGAAAMATIVYLMDISLD